MHAKQSATQATQRTRKWYSSAVVILMGAAISLAACDTGPEPVVDPSAPAVTIPEAAATPEAIATVAPVQEGEGITGTEGMTDTEGMQQVPGTTGAAVGDTGQTMAGVGVVGAGDQYVRASTLLDYSFENIDGEVSGDINDLLVDLRTGRILYSQIEYGGFLGLGQNTMVFPLNAFVVGPEGELVLNFDENALEQYPQVDEDWPNFEDATWDDDIRNFWGTAGVAYDYDYNEVSQTVGWLSEILDNRVGDAAMLGGDAAVAPAVGTPVAGTAVDPAVPVDGNFGIGGVSDILVNLGTGQAKYVLIDYGTGLGGELYVLPMSAFEMTNREDGLLYSTNITPELLAGAPRFDAGLYPDDAPIDAEFGESVDGWWNESGFNTGIDGM